MPKTQLRKQMYLPDNIDKYVYMYVYMYMYVEMSTLSTSVFLTLKTQSRESLVTGICIMFQHKSIVKDSVKGTPRVPAPNELSLLEL